MSKILNSSVYGIFGDSDKLVDDFIEVIDKIIDPKKISDIDEGFIESCIEFGEFGLAKVFLINIYKYSEEEALIKVLNKTNELRSVD